VGAVAVRDPGEGMLGAILRFEVKPEHREAFVQALIEHGHAA
jgi:hypothetical protein